MSQAQKKPKAQAASGQRRSARAKTKKQQHSANARLQIIGGAGALVLLLALVFLPRIFGQPADIAEPAFVEPPIEAADEVTEPIDDEISEAIMEPEPETASEVTVDLPMLEIEQSESVKSKKINLRHSAIEKNKRVGSYERENPIAMGTPEDYAQLPGVTTFRGDHWRGNSAYGTIPSNPSKLSVEWSVNVGGIDDWSGVGWTGQAAIVEWPEAVRQQMNIKASKKEKDNLREVIIGALDGKIRFIDLEDGKATRKEISIGAPIKGSVTIDPRGYPILYCGQGLFEVGGRTVKCGTRVISLIDYKLLYFLDGEDKFRTRNWYCFDAAPIVDGATDTMFQIGENGLVYALNMNTDYDQETGKIKMSPKLDRWGYKSNVTTRPGMENSLAIYNHYGFFVDNSGLMICLDLNALKPIWTLNVGDDTDATTAIDQDEDGLWLYTGNEMDLRGDSGNIQMRCIDALTGKQVWKREASVSNRTLAGAFASPAVGQQGLSDLVFFHISKTSEGATLFALDKKTGKSAWQQSMGTYGWSTPSLIYDKNGKGYILIGSSNGKLRLIDGLTGKLVTSISLENNIEGSPAVYDDMAVVSTRGGKIFGVKIS